MIKSKDIEDKEVINQDGTITTQILIMIKPLIFDLLYYMLIKLIHYKINYIIYTSY